MPGRLIRSLCCLTLVFCAAACTSPSTGERDRTWLDAELRQKTAAGVRSDPADDSVLPQNLNLADGLSMSEAVACSLWNHPDFAAVLLELDISRAALDEAGLLKNPVLSLLFPLGPKQLEATLSLAIDAFWQRPERIEKATFDLNVVSEQIVAAGLAQAHRTRLAFLEAVDAEARVALLAQRTEIDAEISAGLRASFAAGEIGPHELQQFSQLAQAGNFEWEQAQANLSRTRFQLQSLLGPGFSLSTLSIVAWQPSQSGAELDIAALVDLALMARPELRAAEMRVEAAESAARLARQSIPAVEVIVDANAQGSEGFEAGPGLRAEVPLFDRGGAAERRHLAAADLARAQAKALEYQIRVAVKGRSLELQAYEELLSYARDQLLEPAQKQVSMTAARFRLGDASAVDVLNDRRALLAVSLQLQTLESQHLRNWIELEFSVGAQLDGGRGTEK